MLVVEPPINLYIAVPSSTFYSLWILTLTHARSLIFLILFSTFIPLPKPPFDYLNSSHFLNPSSRRFQTLTSHRIPDWASSLITKLLLPPLLLPNSSFSSTPIIIPASQAPIHASPVRYMPLPCQRRRAQIVFELETASLFNHVCQREARCDSFKKKIRRKKEQSPCQRKDGLSRRNFTRKIFSIKGEKMTHFAVIFGLVSRQLLISRLRC